MLSHENESTDSLTFLLDNSAIRAMLKNSAAFVVTLISSLAAFLVILMNVMLIQGTRSRKKNNDLMLFYFRFQIDVLFGFTYFVYSFFILGFTIAGDEFLISNENLFYLGLPFSNISAGRAVLMLLIVIDRVMATYFPVRYRELRPKIPLPLLLTFPLAFILLENYKLFHTCQSIETLHLVIPSCVSFPCTLNQCSYSWWTSYKSVLFPLIIILTVVLAWRLATFSKLSRWASKANRLALLDAVIVFLFDFVPALCANQFPDSPFIAYTKAGPVTGMLKQVGRAIESMIVLKMLFFRAGNGAVEIIIS